MNDDFYFRRPRGVIRSRKVTESALVEYGLDPALACWRNWGSEVQLPGWRKVNLLDLPPHLIAGTMVADVLPGPPLDFQIRYWGTDLAEAFGLDPSGKRLSEVDDFNIMTGFRRLAPEMLKTCKPQSWINTIEAANRAPRGYCVLRLPLATDGENVDGIMTVENIRAHLTTSGHLVP